MLNGEKQQAKQKQPWIGNQKRSDQEIGQKKRQIDGVKPRPREIGNCKLERVGPGSWKLDCKGSENFYSHEDDDCINKIIRKLITISR